MYFDRNHQPGSGSALVGEGLALDRFGSTTDNAVLRDMIRREIGDRGPMTFRRFMQLALYEPSEGYYRTRAAIGPRGDYLTSPELHPLFGAILFRQLVEFWELLDRPDPFAVAEVGAGTGSLARSIISAANGWEFGGCLKYEIVESGMLQREAQRATLGALAEHVVWTDVLPESGDCSCVLSNELLDSFPVHRVTARDEKLLEIFVGLNGDRFVDLFAEPSTPGLQAYFERAGVFPADGAVAEANLDLDGWHLSVSRAVRRGFVLTLDYGYPASTLYAPWRKQGTLHCYSRHTVSTDPYQRIGRQDMTAHVDFTSVVRSGRDSGFELVAFTSQQNFLPALGIGEALAGGPVVAASLEEFLARRRAVEALLDPEGLGRVRVLVQGRAVGRPALRGFPGSTGDGLL